MDVPIVNSSLSLFLIQQLRETERDHSFIHSMIRCTTSTSPNAHRIPQEKRLSRNHLVRKKYLNTRKVPITSSEQQRRIAAVVRIVQWRSFRDMLTNPIVIPIHAVTPDIALLGNKPTSLAPTHTHAYKPTYTYVHHVQCQYNNSKTETPLRLFVFFRTSVTILLPL